MSSHHIVREGQEPALILAHWQELDEALLGELLEWSPVVVVPSEDADELIARQTKVDIVIGRETCSLKQDTIQFIQTTAPFVNIALQHLAIKGHTSAYLASSNTTPQSLLAYMPEMIVTLFSNGMRYYPVRSGFTKWKPVNEMIYMESNENVAYKGLDKVSENVYRTTADGFFTLTFPMPYLVIGEPAMN